MSYCKKCKVQLSGAPKRCPLCQGDISGENNRSGNIFPFVAYKSSHKTMLNWIAFGAIAVAIISIAFNLSFPAGGVWSIFVVGGIASLWISFIVVVKKRSNIPKSIIWQVGIISALSLIWDFFTGFHGWSIDFVIPIIATCAMIAMAAIARLLKLDIEEYVIYLVMNGIVGLVSFLLIVLGILNVVYPSAICFASSLISFAALMLFERKALLSEIHRRTHI